MEENVFDLTTDLGELLFKVERELPTAQVIHDEIGVSWEIIAAEIFCCSRNEVKKYNDFLPKEFYTKRQEEAAQAVLNIWDKVIRECRKYIRFQDGRASGVEDKWKQERPKYERALKFAARYMRPSESELEYIRLQTGNKNYIPEYNGAYDILDVAYDEIAVSNKRKLLEKMETVLKRLPIEQSQKLMTFYGGYAAIAYTPLVACVSIIPESAKWKLKRQTDSMTANTQEQLQRATYHAKDLIECYGIRQGNNVKLRGGWQTVWYKFEEKTRDAWYLYALRMAALVLVFKVWEWKNYELEMLMEYTFFLNDAQQQEVMSSAKELLAAGEIQSAQTMEEIRCFIFKAMKEEEIIERYFKLDIAGKVYND